MRCIKGCALGLTIDGPTGCSLRRVRGRAWALECWPEGQAVMDALGRLLVLGMDTGRAAFASSLPCSAAGSLTCSPALGFWCVFPGAPALPSPGHTAAWGPVFVLSLHLAPPQTQSFLGLQAGLGLVFHFSFLVGAISTLGLCSALFLFLLPFFFPQRGAITCVWCLPFTCGARTWRCLPEDASTSPRSGVQGADGERVLKQLPSPWLSKRQQAQELSLSAGESN